MSLRKKRLILMIGGTSVLLLVGFVIVVGLIIGLVLWNYLTGESEPVIKRLARRPVVYVQFDTPVAPASPVSNQPVQPVSDESASFLVVDAPTPMAPGSSDTAVPLPANTAASSQPQAVAAASTNSSPGGAAASAPTATPTLSMASPLATPTPGPTATPTTTPTPGPSHTPTSTPGPNDTPTPTPTPTNTPAPTSTVQSPGSITGRVLLDGAPVSQGVRLKLEDASYKAVAETTVGTDGSYTFTGLSPSSQGYNVLFAQEWNSQYEMDEVISWGWLGPVAVGNGATVELPDFDIALQGFGQVSPEPNASFSAAAVSFADPIQFEWNAYPGATKYWVDLVRGEAQNVLWQSAPVQGTSLAFDGKLSNGSHVEAGEYWWGVGARRELGSYTLAVYGYLPVLMIGP